MTSDRELLEQAVCVLDKAWNYPSADLVKTIRARLAEPEEAVEPLTADAIKEIWWSTLEQSEDESPEVRFTRFTRAVEKAHGIGGEASPRPAVRLSDDEIAQLYMGTDEFFSFSRAIEAAVLKANGLGGVE